MAKWITPVLDVLDVAQTENGTTPATYESDYAGKIPINGEMWCVASGFLWESGMSMRGYTALERPFQLGGNGRTGTTYYDGIVR